MNDLFAAEFGATEELADACASVLPLAQWTLSPLLEGSFVIALAQYNI